MAEHIGEVVLVGAGPGDPELMTIAGLKEIRSADVIAYDRLGPISILDQARPDAELISVGKEPHGKQTSQEEINQLIVDRALAGKHVVRMKGGDSFLFGRGGEEAIFCAEHGVPVRVIPGVSSAMAGPALAGIPVTHRGLSQGVTIVSGHVAPSDARSHVNWAALAQSQTTLVILMGVTNLAEITSTLMEAGLDPQTAAAIVMKASTPEQMVVRRKLQEIAAAADEEGVQPPAITIIGKVAELDLV